MKISGHTLGTPNMYLSNALRLFKAAGLDAAEIIWQNDYPAGISEEASDQTIREISLLASNLGLEISCLTPYMTQINSLNESEREKDLLRFSRCIQVAAKLNCRNIRVYSGSFIPGEETIRSEKWAVLTESLKYLGSLAEKAGVTLCVENHFNTMTVSSLETVELMEAVNSISLGILYDQANLDFTHNEPFQLAIDMQKQWIRHVHIKDLVFTDFNKPFTASSVAKVENDIERAVKSRVVGTGIMRWPEIIKYLIDMCHYDGYLSIEYEYRWHPSDLPEPEEGFLQSNKYIRNILEVLERTV